MALTGKFLADFSSFYDAVQKAEVSLRSFETGAGNVTTSLNKVADGLSGRKLIQDASLMAEAVERIGGTSKLTEAELQRVGTTAAQAVEKLKALGLDVPPGIAKIAAEAKTSTDALERMKGIAGGLLSAFGVAFSVGAVVNFGKELLTAADDLVRVSDRTGLTIEQVQKLQYVAGQSGNNIDELSAAIGKMQVNLANPKGQEALRELGINFAAFKASNPYDQFRLVADAFAKIPGPAEQARLSVDLFGKTGESILPTLKAKFSELANEVVTGSDKEVRAMDAAGDALGRLATNAKAHAINIAGSFVLAGEAAANEGLLKVFASFVANGGPATIEMLAAIGAAAKSTGHDINLALPVDSAEAYRKQLDEIANATDTLSAKDKALIDRAVELNQSHSDIAAALNLAVGAVDTYIEKQKEAVDQRIFVAKLAEEWHQLYVDMHLTGVKMMEEYTKEVQAAMAKQRDAVQSAQLQLLGLIVEQRKQLDTINGAAVTGVDAQMAALQKKYDADVANIEQMGRAATESGIGGPEWQTKAQEAADNAYRIYVDGFGKIVTESNKTFGSDVPAALNSSALSSSAAAGASGINGPFTAAFQNIGSAADAMAAHVASVLGALTQTDAYRKAGFFVNPGFGTADTINHQALNAIGRTIPSFAGGVDNYGGGTALVGERGPELVNLPRGSSVTPNGKWGGVTVYIGSIVASSASAGREAADALTAHLKSKGRRT
jgi:predicted transcriptional regulator